MRDIAIGLLAALVHQGGHDLVSVIRERAQQAHDCPPRRLLALAAQQPTQLGLVDAEASSEFDLAIVALQAPENVDEPHSSPVYPLAHK